MLRKEVLEQIQTYVHPFRITNGKGFHLKDFDPADTCGLTLDKSAAAELLGHGTEWLAQGQEMLYAQDGSGACGTCARKVAHDARLRCGSSAAARRQ